RRTVQRAQEGTRGDELPEAALAQGGEGKLRGGGEGDAGGARGRLHALLVGHAQRAGRRAPRGELAHELEAQLGRSAERNDLEPQLPLADLGGDERRIAGRGGALRPRGDGDTREPGLDLAEDPVALRDGAPFPGRLLEEGHGAEEAHLVGGLDGGFDESGVVASFLGTLLLGGSAGPREQ